ncbi:MAG: hypothetical protein FWE33_02445 [Defluviitaleaceae bacterium]|nr:hypothetical protein [Defluviitaleaceae bacterium]
MANAAKVQERRNAIVIIILMLILIAAGIFVGTRFIVAQADTRMVAIPPVHTSLRGADGSQTVFGARVVLEVDSGTGNIDTQRMYTEIRSAIDALSIEEVSGFDGTNIMRNAVRERIADHFGEGELVGVLFTDIVSDIPMRRDEPQRNNTIFDAIFGPR